VESCPFLRVGALFGIWTPLFVRRSLSFSGRGAAGSFSLCCSIAMRGSMRLPQPAAQSVGQPTGQLSPLRCLELFSRKTAFVFFGSRKPKGSMLLTLVFFLFFGPPSRTPGKEEFLIVTVFYFVVRSSPPLFAAFEQFFLARSKGSSLVSGGPAANGDAKLTSPCRRVRKCAAQIHRTRM
jgi:hypothetical protein